MKIDEAIQELTPKVAELQSPENDLREVLGDAARQWLSSHLCDGFG